MSELVKRLHDAENLCNQWGFSGSARAIFDAAKRITELEAELDAAKITIEQSLDFEPDENHTIADMANVGRSLMADIKIYRPDYCWNERPSEIVGDLSERITELEASLADSNEALQVMGLKLAHAEGHSANTVGGPTPVPELEDANELLRDALKELVELKDMKEILDANESTPLKVWSIEEEYRERKPKAWALARAVLNDTNPVMDAAPACEPERSVSESIAAGHPCFDPDGPPDHDWKYVDDSFAHEFGTEICGHYECARCDASKPE